MKPLVSILIPSYNAERWIADSIRSALGRTCHNTQIIVVDDGSTDRTLAVAGQFESNEVLVVTKRMKERRLPETKRFPKVAAIILLKAKWDIAFIDNASSMRYIL